MANGGIIGPVQTTARSDLQTVITSSGNYCSPGHGPGTASVLVVAAGGGGGGYGGGGGAGGYRAAFWSRYGGNGGAGGNGAGWNQSQSNGSSGTTGTGSYPGAAGGNGGTLGNDGQQGLVGNNYGQGFSSNRTPGGYRGLHGAAGAAIAGSSYTLSNSGTINGAS